MAISPICAFGVGPGTPGGTNTSDYLSVGQSGVLIGPDMVLTAKHVGAFPFTLPGYGTFSVIVNSERTDPNSDLALFRINNQGMVLPFTTVLDTPVIDGSTITMVGFGSSGVLNSAGTGYDNSLGNGIRRKANAIVNRTEFISYPNTLIGTALISILRENGEGALYGGDSGGGWFQNVNGTSYLVGTSSFINVWGSWTGSNAWQFSSSNDDYFASGAVSLAHASSWLRANGANVVPEPSSWFVLGTVCIVFAGRYRRST